jgi:hypothetical protein
MPGAGTAERLLDTQAAPIDLGALSPGYAAGSISTRRPI